MTFFGVISLLILFLPAWLNRLSLKSTRWFWWPLVISQTSGRAAANDVAYCVVYPKTGTTPPNIAAFRDWLVAEAADDAAGQAPS